MVNIYSNTPQSSGTFGAFKHPSPPKKSFLPYLIIGSMVLILAAGYYLFIYRGISFYFTAPIIQETAPLTSAEIKISQLPRFQFDVFDSSFYKSLKSYGALPIVADSLGRTNPFIPF